MPIMLVGYGSRSKMLSDQLAFGPLEERTAIDDVGEGVLAILGADSGNVRRLDASGAGIGWVQFDWASERYLTASFDGTVRVWDTATGRQLRVLAHSDQMWCAVFDPAGRFVVGGSIDSTIHIWMSNQALRCARWRVTMVESDVSPSGPTDELSSARPRIPRFGGGISRPASSWWCGVATTAP